jgi:predicted nucleic acid-binding protein
VSGSIVDASVAIMWFIDEPDRARAAALLRHPISVPDLLAPECANILWKKVTRGELRTDEAEAIAVALEGADITLHSSRPYLARATSIACALGRAAYDCFYLALAEKLQQPLVTADTRLVNALRADDARRFAHLVVPLSELDGE